MSDERKQVHEDGAPRLDERGKRLHENLTGQAQHARKGQAQSPVEETRSEPPRDTAGHQ